MATLKLCNRPEFSFQKEVHDISQRTINTHVRFGNSAAAECKHRQPELSVYHWSHIDVGAMGWVRKTSQRMYIMELESYSN